MFRWLLSMLTAANKHQLEGDVVKQALELDFPAEEARVNLTGLLIGAGMPRSWVMTMETMCFISRKWPCRQAMHPSTNNLCTVAHSTAGEPMTLCLASPTRQRRRAKSSAARTRIKADPGGGRKSKRITRVHDINVQTYPLRTTTPYYDAAWRTVCSGRAIGSARRQAPRMRWPWRVAKPRS